MGTLLQDLKYSLRLLRKSPGFATVVVLTLALGIGANTAIFSIVNTVLLRALPYREPGQLVKIVDQARGTGLKNIGMSVPELLDFDQRSGVFEDITALWPVSANMTGSDQPARIELLCTSPNYFTMLGAKPQFGRLFGPEDRAPGFAEAVVISDGLWRRSFGADPHVLGRKVLIDTDAYIVVGVLPPAFRHPGPTVASDVDMWATAGFVANPFGPPQRANRPLPGGMGRLKSGMTLAQAQSKLDGFVAELKHSFPQDYPPEANWGVDLVPLQDSLVGTVRPLLLILLGAVAMMLLAGCVNIANLLLARASGRHREVAIRQALGAARSRLIRQMLTESVLLSLIAGVVGVAAASATLRLLVSVIPSKIPRLNEVALDTGVLLFALGVSILTGILFGLAPAIEASGFALAEHLKESSRGSGGSRRQNRTTGLLVISEVAICLVLMIGAGLLVRSFQKLTQADPGFNPQNVLVAGVWLPVPNDPKVDQYSRPEDRTTLVREILRRVRTLPGVATAAMASASPLGGASNPGRFTIEDRQSSNEQTLAETVLVSPDYFTVLRSPLLEGRMFTELDQRGGAQLVALVDRSAAQRFWPNQSPIGKRLAPGRPQQRNPFVTIVGVVGDIRQDGIEVAGVPHVYYPLYQRNGKALALLTRSAADPTALAESLRREVQAVDPTLPVFGVRTLNDVMTTAMAQQRFSAELMGAFAFLALLLAAMGIYGVLAYAVGQRTREIGIRMALGARQVEVIRMVLWNGLRPIFLGVAIGIAGALALSRVLGKLLYGVSTTDPVVFVTVPLVLIAVALLASYVPAIRATRIDPIDALRAE